MTPAAALALALALPAAAVPARVSMRLAEVERDAAAHSPRLGSARAEAAASRRRAEARESVLWPRLSLEGSWRYATEVPALNLGGRSQAFGDNESYSIGPALSWTVFDRGASRKGWRSGLAAAEAAAEEERAAGERVLLESRLDYFRAQLAAEQVRLLADSVRLAQAQLKDIETRRKAGYASRMDALAARQQLLERLRRFRQARSDLASALRELYAAVGKTGGDELSVPLDAASAAKPPEGVEPPTAVVELEPPAETLAGFRRPRGAPGHPSLKAAERQAEAARLASEAAAAGLWPRLTLSGKTSLDYPNGPVLERIHQNTAAVGLSMPLFDYGKTRGEAEELRQRSQAAERLRDAAAEELDRDRRKAQDQLLGLEERLRLNREAVLEAAELSKLTYDSYKAGDRTFLEVQSANLRELEATVEAARTETELLIQLAVLDHLTEAP